VHPCAATCCGPCIFRSRLSTSQPILLHHLESSSHLSYRQSLVTSLHAPSWEQFHKVAMDRSAQSSQLVADLLDSIPEEPDEPAVLEAQLDSRSILSWSTDNQSRKSITSVVRYRFRKHTGKPFATTTVVGQREQLEIATDRSWPYSKRNEEIERAIREDQRRQAREVKILLLSTDIPSTIC
jgi:hypothetical protein